MTVGSALSQRTAPVADFACQVCGAGRLTELEPFRRLPRVTSDCKPFPPGGRLAVCADCSAVQKYPDPTWLGEIAAIYGSYEMFTQSGGVDQVVRDAAHGELRPRAAVLCDRLAALPAFGKPGAWLDFGCGAGAMLAAASERFAGWQFFGHDLDNRHLPRLQPVRGFSRLLHGPAGDIAERFDVISLVHSFEHLVTPHDALVALRSKLKPGGRLFIQVSDLRSNPFDLVVADHLTHFDRDTLMRIVERAGYTVEVIADDWAPKELSLLASVTAGGATRPMDTRSAHGSESARAQVMWLDAVLAAAETQAALGNFGIFGSSIAATWLTAGLGRLVQFYVDEDASRAGRHHLGRPIYPPSQVPPGAPVFIGLIPSIAAVVKRRLDGFALDARLPPPLPTDREPS